MQNVRTNLIPHSSPTMPTSILPARSHKTDFSKMRMILDIIHGIITSSTLFFELYIMKISELVKGDRVRLVDFGQTDLLYRRRLLSLGITRGVELSVLRIAPLGCPVLVEVRGTSLTLRKEEASQLEWERL